MKNLVYIGASLDGYIADKNGNIDYLNTFPPPEGDDMGFANFMNSVDALLMGRNTFETVCNFDIDWPYTKPVFVLSNSLKSIPEKARDKAFVINGNLKEVLAEIHSKGYKNLYIDGGKTIQSFISAELISEMIITTIPVLIGGGTSLFGELNNQQKYKCIESKVFENGVVQNHYVYLGNKN